ncbi:MAG: substrate-binding domain-containing protein [Propionibacteriaceae bacterium]|nr:substrate-binding domain-containing protein [Propionibacteriaceae bacterium]
MKKTAIVMGSILVAAALVAAGVIVVAQLNQFAPADKTGSVNVLLTRPAEWRRIVNAPVVDQAELAMVDGSTATIPISAELLRQFYGLSDEDVRRSRVIDHSTTHQAYERLIRAEPKYGVGGTDADDLVRLLLVTPPSQAEQAEARDRGVVLEQTPIARDGFVFITHEDNPVSSLTVDQVRGIYAGQITNWAQVGGIDRPIVPYQREANSGSQTAMEELVMAGRAMAEPKTTQVAWGMGGLVDAVAEYDQGPASIGYTYDYYLHNLYRNDDIKVLDIDGVSVNDQTIRSGAYPFVTDYFAVVRGDEPLDSPARRLVKFLTSDQGQDVIAMAGYVKAVA